MSRRTFYSNLLRSGLQVRTDIDVESIDRGDDFSAVTKVISGPPESVACWLYEGGTKRGITSGAIYELARFTRRFVDLPLDIVEHIPDSPRGDLEERTAGP